MANDPAVVVETSKFQREFEAQWNIAGPKIAPRLAYHATTTSSVNDLLQDTALRLWRRCVAKGLPADFVAESKLTATRTLDALRWREYRSPKLESQPPQFLEKHSRSFADIWGRKVPGENWRLAEEYSLAPLEWSDRLASIKNEPVLYYLSIGATPREVAEITRFPLAVLRKVVSDLRDQHDFRQPIPIPKNLFAQLPDTFKADLIPLPSFPGLFPAPSAPAHLRKLRGYRPQWIAWFVRLSEHQGHGFEPITLGLIRQLASDDRTLSEEQGVRFLIAASTDEAGLLSQKFIDIRTDAEHRSVSVSTIYQFLHEKHEQTERSAFSDDWSDRIVTFWDPTTKWTELEPW
jgi:hypothetical protein